MQTSYELASSELLRAIRGARSQVGFSRRLGFRSNVAAKWESGQRMPTAAGALRYARRAGVDVARALKEFHPATSPLLAELEARSIAAWLEALRGAQSVNELAARSKLSRFSVSRFLSGRSEPRLSQFLALVDALTDRLPDLVEALVGVAKVPSLALRYQRVHAAREAMFEQPLCLAVMCLLDTRPLDVPSDEQVRMLAATLGRSTRLVRACIQTLLRGGVVTEANGRYRLTGALSIDTHAAPERERRARTHWAKVALERMQAPLPSDLFSYNVFSITRADYAKLMQLQRELFRGARALIAASDPTQIAGLLLVQLIGWDAEKELPSAAPAVR